MLLVGVPNLFFLPEFSVCSVSVIEESFLFLTSFKVADKAPEKEFFSS